MRRDGTTWVIAGVGGVGGGPPQGHVGRFKPKHPRARVAASSRDATASPRQEAPAGTRSGGGSHARQRRQRR